MKIGFRVPSIKKRVAARTSLKRIVRNELGLKAPRGWGWLTNPRKAAYNRVYNRTSIGCFTYILFVLAVTILVALVASAEEFKATGTIDAYFSPRGGATEAIVKEIKSWFACHRADA